MYRFQFLSCDFSCFAVVLQDGELDIFQFRTAGGTKRVLLKAIFFFTILWSSTNQKSNYKINISCSPISHLFQLYE